MMTTGNTMNQIFHLMKQTKHKNHTKKVLKLSMLSLCLLHITQTAMAEDTPKTTPKTTDFSVVLDEVVVTATNSTKKSQKPFTKASATSVRENVFNASENVDAIVRSMPGAFTQQDKSSGLVSLNVRGDSGFGRANSMVDGVTQTFYSTSTDAGRGGGTSQFGAVIDQNFIAGVELNKGSFNGKGGLNTLTGSANFRTLNADDVIKDDKNFGVIAKGLTGKNATDKNFMLAAGGRQWLDNGSISALYAYSHKDISQNYKVGGGGTHIGNVGDDLLLSKQKQVFAKEHALTYDEASRSWQKDLTKLDEETGKPLWDRKYRFGGKCYGLGCIDTKEKFDEYVADKQQQWQKHGAKEYSIAPIDITALNQTSKSHLAKINYNNDTSDVGLQLRKMDTTIGSRRISNDNYQLDVAYNPNEIIDLKVLAAHNVGVQKYPKGSTFTGWKLDKDFETKNTANLFDLNNTHTFNLPKQMDLTTTVGLNILHNEYSKNRFPDELGLFYTNDLLCGGGYDACGGRFQGTSSTLPKKSVIVQPSGKQRFHSIYLDTSLQKDKYQLDYSVNASQYRFSGEHASYYSSQKEFKDKFGEDSQIYKQHCSPSCDVYEPLVTTSGKKHAINHSVTLSAKYDTGFMPFVSFARTHRMPNIQEMFFSQIGDVGVNTALKPEQANTYQLGFNIFKHNLLTDNDTLGLKVLGYESRINNYIHNVYGKWYDTKNPPSWVASGALKGNTIQHRNWQMPVHKQGLELEINYDAGRYFANLSYARQKTDQPTNYSDASESPLNSSKEDQLTQGYGLSKVSMLPKDYGRFEFGVRAFDNKLTVGSMVRYYGQSPRATIEPRYIDGTHGGNTSHSDDKGTHVIKQIEMLKRQPLVHDFYVAYEPIKDLVMRLDVQNAFDKLYIDPLDANNDAATQRYYHSYYNDADEGAPCAAGQLCKPDAKYGGTTRSVLTNFAKGRSLLFSMTYKW